jgi:hypothetical protein
MIEQTCMEYLKYHCHAIELLTEVLDVSKKVETDNEILPLMNIFDMLARPQ